MYIVMITGSPYRHGTSALLADEFIYADFLRCKDAFVSAALRCKGCMWYMDGALCSAGKRR